MNKFEKLLVWKDAMLLVEKVYVMALKLLEDERFRLISQIRRCSISIPLNIVEGAERNLKKEFIRFVSIANGSTSELKTQLLLCLRLKFISEEIIEPLIKLSNEIQKTNKALQKSLSN